MKVMKRALVWHGLLVGFLIGCVIPGSPTLAAEVERCATCHLDSDRIDDLTEDLIAERQVEETSDLQRGEGYTVKRAPFDLFENVLIKEAFLDSPHGKIACTSCHKGNPAADTIEAAHQGMIKDPTLTGAVQVCGECHQEIAKTAAHSSHASLDTSLAALKKRCSPEQWQALNQGAIRQQCATCHESSCGSCHVSRPQVNGGGLVAGHLFQKRPDYLYQCASCHARPVVDDFTGKISLGDIHYLKGKVCVDCHGAKEVHADVGQATSRHAHPARPRCTDCHTELAKSTVCGNEQHQGRVDCTVCHSQAYENCTSCHMGVDQDDLAYSQSGRSYKGFKIGINSGQGKGEPRFVLVRQIPVKADSFAHYLPGQLSTYQTEPTFKRTSVHNLQRKTWQNAHCNHCHGRKELFLTAADLPESEREANQGVIVAEGSIPKPIADLAPLTIAGPKRHDNFRVDAEWLNRNLKEPNLLILDVRVQKQYEEGHIPGARNLCDCFLTHDYKSATPFLLQAPEEIAKALSEKVGLTPDKKVVIYDGGKYQTGVAFLALERIGHRQLAFLDGNITAWTQAGYPLEKGKTPEVVASGYKPEPREVIVSSQSLKEHNDQVLLLDARNLSEYMGHVTRSDVAKKAGRIPGALSLPFRALLDTDGGLKSPEELSWIFAQYGVAPTMEKTLVTSCNTKSLAAELYMTLRYLGHDKVKVHDGSWAEWSRLY